MQVADRGAHHRGRRAWRFARERVAHPVQQVTAMEIPGDLLVHVVGGATSKSSTSEILTSLKSVKDATDELARQKSSSSSDSMMPMVMMMMMRKR
jgi:hypothetical protein